MIVVIPEAIIEICTRLFILPIAGIVNLDIGSFIIIGLFYILLPLVVVLILGKALFVIISKASSAAGIGMS